MARQFFRTLGDTPYIEKERTNGRDTDVFLPNLRLACVPHLSLKGLRKLQTGLYTGDSVLLDRRYRVRLRPLESDGLCIESQTACPEWLIWALQLTLLRARATFVHGASVERGGRALLLPSWGGIGKTAIAARLVKDHGWKLLGDDLVILAENGECSAFLKPMVLYSYHRDVFPEIFALGKGPIAPVTLNPLLSKLAVALKPWLRPLPGLLRLARRLNPQSVRIKPSEAFGKDGLATKAHLHAVVWIDRVAGLTKPVLCAGTREDVASRIFASTLREQDPWCVRATLVACGLGIWRAQNIFRTWLDVLDSGLMRASQWTLAIPAHTPLQDVARVVEDALEPVLREMSECA